MGRSVERRANPDEPRDRSIPQARATSRSRQCSGQSYRVRKSVQKTIESKGGVENANDRLRRWLPRQTSPDEISDEDMQEIVMTYNLTSRKCLGYVTPVQD